MRGKPMKTLGLTTYYMICAKKEQNGSVIEMEDPTTDAVCENSASLSNATNPSQARRRKAPRDLFSHYQRSSGRSINAGKRKVARACILCEQNPPRSRVKIPKAGKFGLRPYCGRQKAPAIFSSSPDCGKDKPAAETNPSKTRSRWKNAGLVR
ncbi:hypothetical protein PIB30_062673 [Stylosanthes scabra]|uniref:Uncharacterized protein n=1 Tax=Stylosanthes scabra TaxID=79078 RepID=A0ABU6UM46_9FABA|nr:hypothetical protein [Stylosanthes scabra]